VRLCDTLLQIYTLYVFQAGNLLAEEYIAHRHGVNDTLTTYIREIEKKFDANSINVLLPDNQLFQMYRPLHLFQPSHPIALSIWTYQIAILLTTNPKANNFHYHSL